MSENSFKRLEYNLQVGPIEKYLTALNPVKSLGEKASGDFYEYQFTISIIMFFSLLIGILSTTMFHTTKQQNADEKYLIGAIMAISWFVFANFSFLVFEGTRLFNVLLFATLMIMSCIATVNIENNEPARNIGISIIALSVFPLIILLYYYLTSEKDEVTKLKTLEREKRREAQKAQLVKNYEKRLRAEIKKELQEDVTSVEGVKSRVANAYIDALIDNAKKNVKVNIEPNKTKEKNKKDKEKKDKKEEDDE